MASRHRNPHPITDRISRVFEVEVWPLTPSGAQSEDGAYERKTITLSWWMDEVPDGITDKVKREALKQFLKSDGWEKDELAQGMASHELVGIRATKATLIKAADTHEAKRAAA